MDDRSRDREREVLPQKLATRVLARASELDAAQRTSAAVDDLRAAAAEAGISATAFDAALAEVRAQEAAAGLALPARPRPRLRRVLAGAAAFVAVVVGFGVMRLTPSSSPAVPTVEQAFTLRCLSPGQAAAFIRPAIGNPRTLQMVSSPDAPGILTVFGTPAQLRQVRSILDRNDSCPLPR